MHEVSRYRLVIGTSEGEQDGATQCELLVIPPLHSTVASVLRDNLQKRADLADGDPKVVVGHPVDNEHAIHGASTAFEIANCDDTPSKIMNELGTTAARVLGSRTGCWVDIIHKNPEILNQPPQTPSIDIPWVPEYL